jgi:outer membrane immunogenic protein
MGDDMTERSANTLRLCTAVGIAAVISCIWPAAASSQEGDSDLARARQLTKIIKSWPRLEDPPENYCAIRNEARALVDKFKQDDAYRYSKSSLRVAADRLVDADMTEHSYWDTYEDDDGFYGSDDPCPPPGIVYIRAPRLEAQLGGTSGAGQWNDAYIGVNGGGAIGTSRWDFSDGSTGTFPANGGLFGVTFGFNQQHGRWVTGIEATIDWASIAGSSTVNCIVGCRTSDSFIAMLNGRAGYGVGAALAFVSGGVAFSNVKLDIGDFSGGNDLRVGWDVGVGVEYMLTHDWSAKVQYNFVQFGSASCGAVCGGAKVPLQENLLLFGLNRALPLGQ